MQRVPIPISGGFYEDSSRPIAAQQCINWVPVVPDTEALSAGQLKGTPGISLFATNGTYIGRGGIVANGVAYFVNGQTLYKVDSAGTSTSLGTIEGTERVSMAGSHTEICIVVYEASVKKGYIVTQSSGALAEITDTDFTSTPPKQVVYKDGYFVLLTDDKFFISSLNDGTSYAALDFGTAELDPDDNTAIHASRNTNILYVAGSNTIEAFQNVGGAAFPFARSGSISKGVTAKHSIIDFDNSFIWLGGGTNEQPAIWRFNGNNAEKISTQAIDGIIQKQTSTQLENVYTTTFAQDGSFFVNVHFEDAVYTYDAAASAKKGRSIWHEKQSRNNDGDAIPWRVNSIITAYGKTLAGDSLGAKIGAIEPTTHTEYGILIDRDFSTGNLSANGNRFIIHELELTMQSGVGDLTTDDPQVTMSMSTDGGYTFGMERSRPMGKTGQYNQRQVWRGLGRVDRFASFKFSVSAPVTPVVIKLEAVIEVLA